MPAITGSPNARVSVPVSTSATRLAPLSGIAPKDQGTCCRRGPVLLDCGLAALWTADWHTELAVPESPSVCFGSSPPQSYPSPRFELRITVAVPVATCISTQPAALPFNHRSHRTLLPPPTVPFTTPSDSFHLPSTSSLSHALTNTQHTSRTFVTSIPKHPHACGSLMATPPL